MNSNNCYIISEVELGEIDISDKNLDVITDIKTHLKPYTYDEALDVAGTGWYSIYLVITMSLSQLSAWIEIFGYAAIVIGFQCEFELEIQYKSALLSLSFLGPIIMSYAWGYLADIRGRRYSLLWAMWASFIFSCLGAFSPNYIISGILKFISSGLCSCALTTSYVLLGESTSTTARGPMMLLMSGVDFTFALFSIFAYFILNMDVISIYGFKIMAWRILAVVLALPLGISAFLQHFVYESPKFLAYMHRSKEALEILRKIWKRNGNRGEYPVKNIIFNEEKKLSLGITLLASLWQQAVPLFKPPLLWRTLQLFYLITVIYTICNGIDVWTPFIFQAFFDGIKLSSDKDVAEGVCAMIKNTNDEIIANNVACSATIDAETVYVAGAGSIVGAIFTIIASTVASRKKVLILGLLTLGLLSGVGTVFIPNNIISMIMLHGVLLSQVCMGVLFSYFVDLYPTSHRGVVTGLGTILARLSSLVGINVVGVYIMNHCRVAMYACSLYFFSGVLVSLFLPPDNHVKSQLE